MRISYEIVSDSLPYIRGTADGTPFDAWHVAGEVFAVNFGDIEGTTVLTETGAPATVDDLIRGVFAVAAEHRNDPV